jgi:WD40 repeat protein
MRTTFCRLCENGSVGYLPTSKAGKAGWLSWHPFFSLLDREKHSVDVSASGEHKKEQNRRSIMNVVSCLWVKRHAHTSRVQALAWSPGGEYLASVAIGECSDAGKDQFRVQVRIWDIRQGALLFSHWGSAEDFLAPAISWCPKGDLLAVACDTDRVCILDVHEQRVVSAYEGPNLPSAVAWFPHGQLIASTFDGDLTKISTDLHMWDAVTGVHVSRETLPGEIYDIAWSPGAEQLAVTGTAQTHLLRWNPAQHELEPVPELFSMHPHEYATLRMAWSFDGRLIATGGVEGTVQISESEAGRLLLVYREHTDQIGSLAWCPNADVLATAEPEGACHLWSTRTGERLLILPTKKVCSLVWSPDGQDLAVGTHGGAILLYRLNMPQ